MKLHLGSSAKFAIILAVAALGGLVGYWSSSRSTSINSTIETSASQNFGVPVAPNITTVSDLSVAESTLDSVQFDDNSDTTQIDGSLAGL